MWVARDNCMQIRWFPIVFRVLYLYAYISYAIVYVRSTFRWRYSSIPIYLHCSNNNKAGVCHLEYAVMGCCMVNAIKMEEVL